MARTRRMQDDFDGAWKNMLSERRFASFVALFMPEAYLLIDWVRPVEFLEQELRAITRKSKRGNRTVDRLVKVWLNDGTENWILVHIEIQSQEDATFPLRMFQYRYRALGVEVTNNPGALRHGSFPRRNGSTVSRFRLASGSAGTTGTTLSSCNDSL